LQVGAVAIERFVVHIEDAGVARSLAAVFGEGAYRRLRSRVVVDEHSIGTGRHGWVSVAIPHDMRKDAP